jgi:hypothetical protein
MTERMAVITVTKNIHVNISQRMLAFVFSAPAN